MKASSSPELRRWLLLWAIVLLGRCYGFTGPPEFCLKNKFLSKASKNGEEFRIIPDGDSHRRKAIQAICSTVVVGVIPSPSLALSPKEASNAYDSYAKNYDGLDGGIAPSILGIDEARTQLLKEARGRVLEIGVGTGLNLDRYNTRYVSSITVVDISDGMLNQARSKINMLNPSLTITFVKADATSQLVDLFGENSFDTAVDTFSLCVMGNTGAKQCLDQLSQVVKSRSDGGRLLLLENSRSSISAVGWYQDVTAESVAFAGGKGCVYNQNVADFIRKTKGLEIVKEEAYAAGLFRSFECVKNEK